MFKNIIESITNKEKVAKLELEVQSLKQELKEEEEASDLIKDALIKLDIKNIELKNSIIHSWFPVNGLYKRVIHGSNRVGKTYYVKNNIIPQLVKNNISYCIFTDYSTEYGHEIQIRKDLDIQIIDYIKNINVYNHLIIIECSNVFILKRLMMMIRNIKANILIVIKDIDIFVNFFDSIDATCYICRSIRTENGFNKVSWSYNN